MTDFDIRRATPEDARTLARLNAFVHDLHVEAQPHYFRPTDLEGETRPDAVLGSIAELPGWWEEHAGG